MAPMNTPATDNTRPIEPIDCLLSWPEVQRAIGLSRPQIWRLRRDGNFPAPLRLSTHRVGWRVSELRAWLDSRARA